MELNFIGDGNYIGFDRYPDCKALDAKGDICNACYRKLMGTATRLVGEVFEQDITIPVPNPARYCWRQFLGREGMDPKELKAMLERGGHKLVPDLYIYGKIQRPTFVHGTDIVIYWDQRDFPVAVPESKPVISAAEWGRKRKLEVAVLPGCSEFFEILDPSYPNLVELPESLTASERAVTELINRDKKPSELLVVRQGRHVYVVE